MERIQLLNRKGMFGLACCVLVLASFPGCLPADTKLPEPSATPHPSLEWVTPVVTAPNLQHRTFYSEAIGETVSYHILVPDEYATNTETAFSVLYWLHGMGDGLRGLPALARHFKKSMESGDMPLMLVVFPNGFSSSMWCDSYDGRLPVETVLIRDLLSDVDASFRTVATREGRVIEGFSMGGYGAGRLGFKYHELFGGISMLGAGPLDPDFRISSVISPGTREMLVLTIYGDMEYFRAQSPWHLAEEYAAEIRDRTLIRVIVGEQDHTLPFNHNFHQHLSALDIPHRFSILAGVGHNPIAVLNSVSETDLHFYSEVLTYPGN